MLRGEKSRRSNCGGGRGWLNSMCSNRLADIVVIVMGREG